MKIYMIVLRTEYSVSILMPLVNILRLVFLRYQLVPNTMYLTIDFVPLCQSVGCDKIMSHNRSI